RPMAPGEAFLGDVYRIFASDPARWARTVFIVTYDEHGGFFDHVPPQAVKSRNPNGIAFDTTGPRVPTIVAGAFAPQGVSKTVLDNTSILQLLAERFGPNGEAYSPEVAARTQQGIASVSSILSVDAANVAPAPMGVASRAPVVVPAPPTSSKLRAAFGVAAKNLVLQHKAEALAKYPELRGTMG